MEGMRDVVEDDLKKGRLDRSLAKDRDRWKAQIMGKTSDLCEHGKRDVNEKRERDWSTYHRMRRIKCWLT